MALPTAGGSLRTAKGSLANVTGRGGGSTVEVIEDWESGGFSENSWSGDTANYTVASGGAAEGTYYLEGEGDPITTTTAPNLPERGDYFKVLFSGTGNGDRFRMFWGPDPQGFGSGDSYMFWHDTDGFIRLYDAGPRDLIGEVSVDGSNITDGEWWEVHVDYGYSTNDDIEILFYGTDGTLAASLNVTNTAHSNAGGVQFRHYDQQDANNPMRADYIHVNNDDQSQVL